MCICKIDTSIGYSEKSSKKDIASFFEKIAQSDDAFLLQTDKVDSGEYPSFVKEDEPSHVIYKEVRYHNILENLLIKDEKIKVIGIIRNPFAVVSSFS